MLRVLDECPDRPGRVSTYLAGNLLHHHRPVTVMRAGVTMLLISCAGFHITARDGAWAGTVFRAHKTRQRRACKTFLCSSPAEPEQEISERRDSNGKPTRFLPGRWQLCLGRPLVRAWL
jgi:hypothetical protein